MVENIEGMNEEDLSSLDNVYIDTSIEGTNGKFKVIKPRLAFTLF